MYAFGIKLRNVCNFSNLKLVKQISSRYTCNCISSINKIKTNLLPKYKKTFVQQAKSSVISNQLRFFRLVPVKRNNNLQLEKLYRKKELQNKGKYEEIPYGKLIGYWLLSCSGFVFIAVVLGGVTRLTESGLSMVTWRFYGESMPRTDYEWEKEFEKYKQFPEFQIKNKDITLGDFKWIWKMEYFHRMWGRFIGLVFLLPAGYLLKKVEIPAYLRKRIIMLGCLIVAQGVLGWYMVQSGLEDRFDGPNDVPRVSQYRLAAHLTLAFVLYAAFLRSSLELLSPALQWPVMNNSIMSFKIFAHSCKGLVFLTAISGAFVAGLDAGLIYNSFPKMADNWIPEDILYMSPVIKNFFENPTTVQFDHRILGTTTLSLITALWLWSFKFKLPPGARFATNAFAIMAYTQVALGITTLLTYVPVYLAVLHQCGSLILLSLATWLTHELKYIKRIAK